jgi:hypothetical protein
MSASPAIVELTSLKLLLQKKLISQDEYDSAVRDMADSIGSKGLGDSTTLVLGKFATTLYGFAEADAIHDSTQSFTELQGNALVARDETGAGNYGRLEGSIRNSRLGVRIKAPEFHSMRLSAQLEMDFLGNQSPIAYGQPYAVSEASFYANPSFRARHVNLKLETPIVDVLFGQSWNLFGWQPYFHPATVDYQGVPAQLYTRRPQLRVSKILKTSPVNVEIAVAALTPVQRDSEVPEMQAGARLTINGWKGRQTIGSTGTQITSASIGISGDMKYVKVPYLNNPNDTTSKAGTSIAASAFLPVIPGSDEKAGNQLSLTGEFVTGYGNADQYTGLTGGVGFPAGYAQNIDNGIVTFDAGGDLHFVQWTSMNAGLQYYLPGVGGRLWVSANFGHIESPNARDFGNPAKVRRSLNWVNANFFADPAPGFRLGLSYGRTYDEYGDGETPINDRVQGSAFFIF